MAIGRTQDRNTPGNPLGRTPRCDVWDPIRVTHLGPRSNMAAHQGRIHDRNRPDPSLRLMPSGAVHPNITRAALRTGYSFNDEEVVNKMPFFSGLELDHFSDRLHVIEPGIFLRLSFERRSANKITIVDL